MIHIYNKQLDGCMSFPITLNSYTRAINHRGYSIEAPENTLPAYILSAKKGFRYVECDIAFTKDSVPVLLHDETIDRTSNGSGAIYNLTLSQVRSYDFGNWKGTTYTGTTIPTLEEFVILCRDLGLHPYIELKSDGNYTTEQIQSVVDIVNKYGLQHNVTYISFKYEYLQEIIKSDNRARVGYLVANINSNSYLTSTDALRTGYNDVFIETDYSRVTDNVVELCKTANIPLEVYTVDDKNWIKTANDYISGFTSNSQNAEFIRYEKYI